jgi:5-methylcytosine-specific restriction endonuclease McrA
MKWQREAKAVRRSITLRSYRKNLEYSREYSVVKRGNLKAKALGQICRVSLQEWRDLKAKYNNQCLKCLRSEPEVKVSMDHVIPLSQGGLHHIDNIQPLCISCNTSKMIKSTDYRKTYSA